MVEIHPADEGRTKEALAALGQADGVCLQMSENGREIGFSVYAIADKTATLTAMFSEDITLLDLLFRGTLHSAQLRGADAVFVADKTIIEQLKRYALEPCDGGVQTGIDAFFNRPCAGCAEAVKK